MSAHSKLKSFKTSISAIARGCVCAMLRVIVTSVAVTLDHSRSFEITLSRVCVCVRSYLLSIVSLNMCLYFTVTDTFGVEYCRNVEFGVRVRSRSLKMIDRSYMTYYWSTI